MGYFGNPYQMGYNPYSGYAPASPQNGVVAPRKGQSQSLGRMS